MAISRHSVSQREFNDEYQRIKAKRNAHIRWLIIFEFISSLSNAFVVFDMASLLGFQIPILFSLSLAALPFFGLLAASFLYGVFCVSVIKSEGEYRKQTELNLKEDCFKIAEKNTHKINKFKVLLEKLLEIKEDSFLRSSYLKIVNNENKENKFVATREVNGYIKHIMQENFPGLVRQPKHREENNISLSQDQISHPEYWKFAAFIFSSSVLTVLGVASSIIALLTLSTPVLLGVLAAVFAAAIIIGAVTAYFDYKSRRSQQEEIDLFENDKAELFAENKRLNKTMLRMEEYMVTLTLQKQLSDRSPDETVIARPFFGRSNPVSSGEPSPLLSRSSPDTLIVSGKPLDGARGVADSNASPRLDQ